MNLPPSIQKRIDSIVDSIEAPRIPDRELDFNAFAGHEPDEEGSFEFRESLLAAIDRIHSAGGGRVYLRHPQGRDNWMKVPMTYRIRGPVHLKSRTELLIDRGLTLFFEFSPADYLPGGRGVLRRYEGTMVYSFSPLIYALGAEDIAVRSAGGAGGDPVIDGDGFRWQKWMFAGEDRRKAEGRTHSYQLLKEHNNNAVPATELQWNDPDAHFLRPCAFEPIACRRVALEGVRFVHSPFWVVHPVFCESVAFRDLSFYARPVNNDGIDPDSCRNVLIERIFFDNHDDNVALKSGRDREAREGALVTGTELESVDSPYRRGNRIGGPTENVLIRNCVFKGHYAICIGSEIGAGARNVIAVNNLAPQEVNMGLFLKSARGRGGIVEDVYVGNLDIHHAKKDCIALIPNYDKTAHLPHPPLFRRITVENVRCSHAGKGVRVFGWPDALTADVKIRNLSVDKVTEEAFVCNNVDKLSLENVRIGETLWNDSFSLSDSSTETPLQI